MQTVNWYKNSKELKIRMCLSIQKNYWQVSLAESSTNNREMSNILFILLPLVVAQEVSELLILNSWFNLLHTTITTISRSSCHIVPGHSHPPKRPTDELFPPRPATASWPLGMEMRCLKTLEMRSNIWNPYYGWLLWLTINGRCATTRQAWHWEAQTTGTSPSTSRQGGP